VNDEREWLESMTVAVGGEVTWQSGELRLCLDQIEFRGDGSGWRLPRYLGGKPAEPATGICSLAVRLATPWRPLFPYGSLSGFPAAFPMIYGPFDEDAPLLSHRRGAVFEITTIVDEGRGAVVRAGRSRSAPDVDVHGEVRALDPLARRFVAWWLELPSNDAWASPRVGPLPYKHLEGYGLTLSPLSTGSLAVTFHRDGDRHFVRTYGGCFVTEERWYGPYVERGGGFALL
jgi:hypothetical protein